jgi:hypothetical protein
MLQKILLLFTVFIFKQASLKAQEENSKPLPFLQSKEVPPVTLILTNDSVINKNNFPKEKLLIIYFNPDCGHCQVLTKHLTDSISYLKDYTVIMATYSKMKDLKKFEEEFNIKQHPNILLARDKTYFLVPFYGIKTTPFVAAYTKRGKLYKYYTDDFSIKDLLEL